MPSPQTYLAMAEGGERGKGGGGDHLMPSPRLFLAMAERGEGGGGEHAISQTYLAMAGITLEMRYGETIDGILCEQVPTTTTHRAMTSSRYSLVTLPQMEQSPTRGRGSLGMGEA